MKKIIVLSDGTGNGAAKKNKTNVWRLYRALNLQTQDQIAMYDDGVGSQQFLPLKILGGAFGFGLKENVLQLYKFLCRNYEAEKNDKIYLFGFSRGAFTVRLLASFIRTQGLYQDSTNEEDLDRIARKLYRAYREGYAHNLFFKAINWIKKRLTGRNKPVETVKPEIEFLGVWDTVDAYGLPIDELAILWHHCIFPIRFPNYKLGDGIRKACHAISIDDERLTFHPVLWDEYFEKEPDRIEQVWFAGVHSDVGGGYPMSNLSLVTLDWMISRLQSLPETSRLHLIKDVTDEYEKHADWHGKQHDSRAGLASYYRYKPRDIGQLCNDVRKGVKIERPKIHRGVFERIEKNVVPYAPTGLPDNYRVVATRGDEDWPYEANRALREELLLAPDETRQEAQTRARTSAHSNASKRYESLNYARDYIFKRQTLYLAILITTTLLFASRFFLDWTADGACKSFACLLDPLLAFASNHLPDFTMAWFDALRQNPLWLYGFIAAFALFFVYLKPRLWSKTQIAAANAWAGLKNKGERKCWRPTPTSYLRKLSETKLKDVAKWAVTFAAFILILAVALALLSRTSFYARSSIGLLKNKDALFTSDSRIYFETKDPFYETGIELKQGELYRFSVTPAQAWLDGSIAANPEGFNDASLTAFVLLRRSLSEPWFKLMGKVGLDGNEEFPIGLGPSEYQAKSDGQLFLYANDAVLGFLFGPYWASPYFWPKGKNRGTAKVEVYRKISGACPKINTATSPKSQKTERSSKTLVDCWLQVKPSKF